MVLEQEGSFGEIDSEGAEVEEDPGVVEGLEQILVEVSFDSTSLPGKDLETLGSSWNLSLEERAMEAEHCLSQCTSDTLDECHLDT